MYKLLMVTVFELREAVIRTWVCSSVKSKGYSFEVERNFLSVVETYNEGELG